MPPVLEEQHRQGNVATATRLPVYVRYRDIVSANIARNWPTLLRLIDHEGFPEGILIGRNSRAWDLADVEEWLKSRPTARRGTPHRVKANKETATG